MTYSVGQIIYIVFSKQATIVPCLVVEENTKKTLDGQKTEYRVILAVEPNSVVDLHRIDGKFFTNLNEASEYLTKKFNTYIEMQKNKAKKLASQWEKHQKVIDEPKTIKDVPEQQPQIDDTDEYVIVELPDGTKARAKLPTM
jgi:hypothetical protein